MTIPIAIETGDVAQDFPSLLLTTLLLFLLPIFLIRSFLLEVSTLPQRKECECKEDKGYKGLGLS